jgi:hypothetical protein
MLEAACPSLEMPIELSLYPQDLIQSSDDHGCDYQYFAQSSDTESELSISTPPNVSQVYDDGNAQDSRLDDLSYEGFGDTLSEGSIVWRESAIWSMLHDGWPRID